VPQFVRCLTVEWIASVSFLQGQEFLCTVVCPHVPLYLVCFGNPPWLETVSFSIPVGFISVV
jgi:hypothetical protein